MNQSQALRMARKLLGPKATVRDDGKPSSPEGRSEAKTEWLRLKELRERTADKTVAILLKKKEDVARWESFRYRCVIGRIVMGMFNEVNGQGDNFEEALEAAKRRLAA